MNGTAVTLGQTLPELALQLDDLFDTATDATQRTNISIMQKRIHDLLEPLIDSNLDRADQAYKDAVSAVQQATDAIKAAQQDLQKVAQAINAVADVISKIDKVAGVVTKI
jgi:hypothetical protein